MRTRDEILLKFAALVEQDAKELDPEFEKTLVPGYGKRKEHQFEGTPEYHPGISGRKDDIPDVSRGYGVSKRNAKILAEENPEEYVHKKKYHLVGKLNEITSNMLMNIIENTPEKYFEYRFHHVPEFGKIDDAAWRSLVRKNPLEAVRKQIFDKPEFVNLLVPLFKLAIKKLGWSTNDLKYFSTKLRALSDNELKTGLHELVFLIRAKQSDSFFQDPNLNMLKYDSYFKKLFVEEEAPEKLSMTQLDLISIKKLGELLQEAVDIPMPPVPTNLSVAPPSKVPAGPSTSMQMPMELPEVEPEPTPEEERAFQERQRRYEIEDKMRMAKPIPAKIVTLLEQLPNAMIKKNRAEGSWTKGDKHYMWGFEVEETRPGIDKASYYIEIVEFPVTLTGKSSHIKPKVLFEQTGENSVILYKSLRGAIAELLSKQRYISDEQKERHQEREETRQEEKEKSESEHERNQRQKEFNKWLEEGEDEEEKSLSFLRAKDIITKVSIRLKTKGFVDEAKKLEEVIQNLKY